ncbi:MAG: CapA family protein [Spirochaetales bacterium]|nr:CapA family protein [Spirochaetales bacterium]
MMKKKNYFLIIQAMVLCAFFFHCCSPLPRKVWIDAGIPAELSGEIRQKLMGRNKIEIMENREKADVIITASLATGSLDIGTWFYAVVTPFFSMEEEIGFSELKSLWAGKIPDTGHRYSCRKILVNRDTFNTLSIVLDNGEDRQSEQDRIVENSDLIDKAWKERMVISIVPFHELSAEWKVLRLSGFSLLDRDTDMRNYPLSVHINARGDKRGLSIIKEAFPVPFSNRDERKMTVVIMTGVTALTRQTAWVMEQNGITWPAKDIKGIFKDTDFVHVSNEVSFIPDYKAKPVRGDTLLFASHDNYIELLEFINVNIVELTGNHLFDYGEEAFLRTLDMYKKKGWYCIGGGKTIHEAKTPAQIVHGPNKLVFFAYLDAPSRQFAGEYTPGSVKKNDWPELFDTIRRFRREGWLPVVCVQDGEIYNYKPPGTQVKDFRALAKAGAVIVQGSHAHQPQAFDFHYGSFIHHGLGNFFFDQMWSTGTRQGFIDKHVFYNGKHISTVLYTTMLEDYARPRFMNEAERKELLSAVFDESWRNEVKAGESILEVKETKETTISPQGSGMD